MNGRVTQAEVAKRANVHVTTVSLALRNHASIPPSTRTRIQALAEKMGYRPDPALRALMAYRSRLRQPLNATTLAYVNNWPSQWGWKESPAHFAFFAGASAKAAQLGYQLEPFWLGEAGLSHRRMSDILVARGIAGLVIASHTWQSAEKLQFEWSRFSAVKIDFIPHDPPLHNVTNDQRSIIQMAMRRVQAAGYRRIGLVMPGWWDYIVDLAWSAGFLAEQQSIPPAQRIPILYYAEQTLRRPSAEDPAEALVPKAKFETWLQRYRPQVLISYRPFVQARLVELGLRVPDDIAFVDVFRLDDDHATAGVRQNCRRVGEVAIETLASQLAQNNYGIPVFQTTTLVEGTWFDGASLPPADQLTRQRRRARADHPA